MFRQPRGEGAWLFSFVCTIAITLSIVNERRRQNQRKDTGLPKEWAAELRDTTRPGQTEKASVLVTKALQTFMEGDYRHAASLSSEAKKLAQRSARVRELLGLSLYHAGDFKEALREFQAFKRMSGSLEQNHLIADCYRADGRPDKALEVLGEVKPKDVVEEVWVEVLIVAASTLADKGQFDRALSQLSRGDLQPKEVQPHHLRLWYVRAEILEKAGKQEEARAQREKIAREDPEFFDVSEKLGTD
jgi:Flp pilus assembly protein TadD